MKQLFYWILLTSIAISCNFRKKGGNNSEENTAPNSHKVTVSEVIQTGSYTYLKLKEDDKEYWAAVSSMEAKPGQTYYYQQSMEMRDFKSKELNRTFSSIYFIDNLSDQPITQKKKETLKTTGRQMVERATDIKVKPAEGGVTISTLMTDKSKFDGKIVRINGKVMKYSADIMGKNWVHLQDGTEAGGQYDLVITTMDQVKPGDVVTFEGKISLNKDFGYGYKYDVLMEDAKASDIKSGI
jgi:predicted RNA-binding protein